jgi:hypothetical protein
MQLAAYQSNTNFPAEITKTKQTLKTHTTKFGISHELMPSLLVRFGLFDALEDLKIQTH